MERIEVYKLIDGEREFQQVRHEQTLAKFPHRDEDHSIADWVIYMEDLLSVARNHIYNLRLEDAKETIRKVTALGVACMEYNETKPRVMPTVVEDMKIPTDRTH